MSNNTAGSMSLKLVSPSEHGNHCCTVHTAQCTGGSSNGDEL